MKLIWIPQFTSGIRPPSHIPTPAKLFEMSASATNARTSAMAPPENTLKRKTLAERGGEPLRAAAGPPGSKSVNTHVRNTSITSVPRGTSLSSSVSSSRPSSSASTRNVSNSSYSSSISAGSRHPSSQSYRPQSAMSQSRIQKPASTQGRPATSLEVYEEEPGMGRDKRKGRTPFSLNPQEPQNLHAPKVRGSTPMRVTSNGGTRNHSAQSLREISLNTRMNCLSLDDERWLSAPIAEIAEEEDQSPSCVLRSAPKVDKEVPKTPSHIPKLAPRTPLPGESPTPSPNKLNKKASRSQIVYLNKDSNMAVEFNTETRLEEVENMYSELKRGLHGATSQNQSLSDSIAIYKIKSILPTI